MDSPTPEELDALDRLTDDRSAAGASPDTRALADLVHAITDATQDGDGLDVDATWRRIQTAIRAERVDATDSRAATLPAPPSEAASMQRRKVPASRDSTRLIVAVRRFTHPSVPAVRSFMPAALAAGVFAVAITLSLLFLTSNSASAGFLATVARLEEAASESLADGVLTSEELDRLDVRVAAVIASIDAESDLLPDIPADILDAALATVKRIGGELQTVVAGQIADDLRDDSPSVAARGTHLRRFARVAVAALADVPASVRKVIGPSKDAQGEAPVGEEAEPARPPRAERPDADTPAAGGAEAEPVRPPQAERPDTDSPSAGAEDAEPVRPPPTERPDAKTPGSGEKEAEPVRPPPTERPDADSPSSVGEEAEPVRPPLTERPDADSPSAGGEEAEPVRPPPAERPDTDSPSSGAEDTEPVRPTPAERPDADSPSSGAEEAEPVRPPPTERPGRSDSGATGRTNSSHVEATAANGACKDDHDPADLNSVHWPCPTR